MHQNLNAINWSYTVLLLCLTLAPLHCNSTALDVDTMNAEYIFKTTPEHSNMSPLKNWVSPQHFHTVFNWASQHFKTLYSTEQYQDCISIWSTNGRLTQHQQWSPQERQHNFQMKYLGQRGGLLITCFLVFYTRQVWFEFLFIKSLIHGVDCVNI